MVKLYSLTSVHENASHDNKVNMTDRMLERADLILYRCGNCRAALKQTKQNVAFLYYMSTLFLTFCGIWDQNRVNWKNNANFVLEKTALIGISRYRRTAL